MNLDTLLQAEKRAVGVKQTEKAVAKNNAAVVYVAADADERITERLLELCRANDVKVVEMASMNDLGKACGIHVKAAAAAVLKA